MGWMQIVGAGISAISQAKAGSDADSAMRADAALKAAQIKKLSVRTQGEARGALAGSGVDVNSPTAKVINSNIAGESDLDAMNTILSGGRAGSVAKTAGRINALGTVTGALGSDYGQSALGKVGQAFGRWKTAAPPTGGVGTTGPAGGY